MDRVVSKDCTTIIIILISVIFLVTTLTTILVLYWNEYENLSHAQFASCESILYEPSRSILQDERRTKFSVAHQRRRAVVHSYQILAPILLKLVATILLLMTTQLFQKRDREVHRLMLISWHIQESHRLNFYRILFISNT